MNEQEQQALQRLYQAFCNLPNADDLRLCLYADGGGNITRVGRTMPEDQIIITWTDLEDGADALQAYAEYLQEEQED